MKSLSQLSCTLMLSLWISVSWSQLVTSTQIDIVSIDVLFDSDHYQLRAEDSTLLEFYLDSLSHFGDLTIAIDAHTDNVGSDDYNELLSLKRMNSVADFFGRRNIDSTFVNTGFFGEREPRAVNETEEGRQQNRRASILFSKSIRVVNFTGRLTDKITKEGIGERHIHIRSKIFQDSAQTDLDGFFSIRVPLNQVAGVDAFVAGYYPETKMFKMDARQARDTMQIVMSRIMEGGSLNMQHFYFVGSKAILLPKSSPELHKLKKLMAINAELCIEIVGHVNYPHQPPVSEESFEYNLSVARSKSIYEELIEAGVDSDRMFYSGRGNREMIHPKAVNEQEQRLNRRVEVVIRDCEFVNAQTNSPLDELSFDFY